MGLAAGLLACAAAWADSPTIDGPAAVPRDRLVRLAAKGVPAKAGLVWRVYPREGVDRADAPKGRLQFVAPPGRYTVELLAVTVGDDEVAIEEATFTVTVGGEALPPPKPDDPPPAPSGGLYFVVIRPDAPADPAFTRVMGLPAWEKLRAAGHRAKDFTPPELARIGLSPAAVPAQLPAVVTLRTSPAGSRVVRDAVPLPTTDAGILQLVEGVRP